jgi:hypothetical protein
MRIDPAYQSLGKIWLIWDAFFWPFSPQHDPSETGSCLDDSAPVYNQTHKIRLILPIHGQSRKAANDCRMPTYRERVYICPDHSGQPGWILEFPLWWNRQEFFKEYGDCMIEAENPFYVDYGILLTVWEAVEWDKRCRVQFAREARSQEPFYIDAMLHWEALLKTASWVIVESYEWESGLS